MEGFCRYDLLIARAATGCTTSMCLLGNAFMFGINVPLDVIMALTWFHKASAAGDAHAAFQIGRIYEVSNRDMALEFMCVAAARGYIDAQTRLLLNYASDAQVWTRRADVQPWLRKLADAGDVVAQFTFAMRCHTDGKSEVAVKYFEKAAHAGHADAAYMLSIHFNSEKHKDPIESMIWLGRAVRDGHARAKNDLGVRYLKGGDVVPQDEVLAFKFFEEAAVDGDVLGMFNAGCCLSQGAGVERDVERAKLFLSRAAAGGISAAKDMLQQI